MGSFRLDERLRNDDDDDDERHERAGRIHGEPAQSAPRDRNHVPEPAGQRHHGQAVLRSGRHVGYRVHDLFSGPFRPVFPPGDQEWHRRNQGLDRQGDWPAHQVLQIKCCSKIPEEHLGRDGQ